MSQDNKKVSLWNLLNTTKVIIPIIQRDYAQGRNGNEFLREGFIQQLFGALLSPQKPLVLDFVYGSKEKDTLYPLDGQQRLTTLWLLHWYLSLYAGTLQQDKEVLDNFSYETRISSRTFCHQLCSITQPYQPSQNGIREFIRNQCWFYASYQQDPTIQSMLTMLGGTDTKINSGNDIIDNIEKYCLQINLTEDKAKELLQLLKKDTSPISFFLLNMEDKNMPLTDDLYIKMNARGKRLTDFENFKADLLKYKLPNQTNLIPENDTKEGSFSQLLDTRWTDLFWPYRSTENHIDEIFFAFLNRFFLNWLISHCDSQDDSEKDILNSDSYRQILKIEKGESVYQSISIYKPVLTPDCIGQLHRCLNSLCELDPLLEPGWENNSNDENPKGVFYFIPRYKNENTPVPLEWKTQVVFHAVCTYLTNCQTLSLDRLKDWIHVVWNIVENITMNRQNAVSAIRFFDQGINKLSKSNGNLKPGHASDDIISFLANCDESHVKESFCHRQLMEEIAKAKQITKDENWKKKIYDAEKFAFFKGAIPFLFQNEIGETDWNNFDTKLNNAKQLFDRDGVKTDRLVDSLQTLYSYCKDWDTQIKSRNGQYVKIFNGRADTWKYNILTKTSNDNNYLYAESVHHLLMGDGIAPAEKILSERRMQKLTSKPLISFIDSKIKDLKLYHWDMYIREPHDALYFQGKKCGVMLDFEERDQYLNALLDEGIIEIAGNNEQIPGTGLFWGDFDINFTYHSPQNKDRTLHLQWYQESRNNWNYDIYLMTDTWGYEKRMDECKNESGDRRKYYCFNVGQPSEGSSLIEHFCQLVEENFKEIL